jgi:hypothetical protein
MIIPFRSSHSVFDQTNYDTEGFDDTTVQDGTLTLPQFWHTRLKPDRLANLSPRTISSDLDALSAWKQFTDDIDLLSLRWRSKDDRLNSLRTLRAQLQKFVRVQLQKGISGTSINTRLRHIRSMLRMASDPIEHGIIDHVPDLGRQFTGTKSCWQIKATRRKPRETVTCDEMERLFHATAAADNPHLWKVIILLLWTYGARTEDHFFRLDWSLIDPVKMLMQFTANKTSKLQGVPLTPLILRALRSLPSWRAGDVNPLIGPIFGKLQKGSWNKSEGWKTGYYCTWSRDILPAGRFEVRKGPSEHKAASLAAPDVRPNLMFHHFRKTMVTELNIYSGQAGNWVAAHYMSGVSEVFYDLPTERIQKAVADREAERLPECFKQYFSEVSPRTD